MVRWGVIGAGGFADRRVIPQIKKAKGCELEGIMVRDINRAEKLAQKHGARKFYDSADSLLEDTDIDAVYICTPVYLHKELTIKAAESGKHILCEKPIALDVKEGKEMIEACDKYNVKLMIGFMMRFHPAHKKAKELINEGTLGDIVLANIQNFLWYPPMEGHWRQKKELGGGGVLMDVGSHCIDLLSFLLGKVTGVVGVTKSIIFDYPVEDTSTVIMDFERGSRGIVENSFAIPHRENHLEIYGTRGSILISKSIGPFYEFSMKLITEKGEEKISLSYDDPYRQEFEEFAEAIEKDKPSPVSGQTGLENIKIIKASYLSWEKRGKRIEIEDG